MDRKEDVKGCLSGANPCGHSGDRPRFPPFSVYPPNDPEIIEGDFAVVPNDQGALNQFLTGCRIPIMPAVKKFASGYVGVMTEDGGVHEVDIVFIVSDGDGIMSLLPFFLPVYTGPAPCLEENDGRSSAVDDLPEIIDCHAASFPHPEIALLRVREFPVGKSQDCPIACSPLGIRSQVSGEFHLAELFPVIQKDGLKDSDAASVIPHLFDQGDPNEIFYLIKIR